MSTPVIAVYEDELSGACARRLLGVFGDKYLISHKYHGRGNGYIRKNILAFNNASKGIPFIVLTDLDQYRCPFELINDWMRCSINKNLIFRVAVREVESWLLANREGVAELFGVPIKMIPQNPDLIADPKKILINIAKKSKKKDVKCDIVPVGKNAAIGPAYNSRLSCFVDVKWDIKEAIVNSESLSRAYKRLSDYEYDIS